MKRIIIFIFAAVLLLGNSCTKDFLSVNEVNPNTPSAVPSKFVLAAAMNNLAAQINNPRFGEFVYLWHGLWTIQPNYAMNRNLTQYDLLNQHYQNNWREFYITGQNFDYFDAGSKNPKDVYAKGVAKIMKAYIFQNLVDIYGDVPYTDAFKANAAVFKPKYDNQEVIYTSIVEQINEAIALIQGATAEAGTLEGFDHVYKGNMQKWLKFANTLKLRILINQRGLAAKDAYIKEQIANTASIGYIGVGEGAFHNPGYTAADNKMNPFWEVFYKPNGTQQSDGVSYYGAGGDAVKFMTDNADPRLGRFFAPVSGTTYVGVVYGDQNPPAACSKIGPGLLNKLSQDAIILSDWEALFLQAEAVQAGYITGNAKELYESAVTRNFIFMGKTAIEAVNYLGQNKLQTNFDNATNKIELILTQKWLALNGFSPFVIWTDYRRTGFPSFLRFSPDPGVKNATPPVRLLYPQTEISTNNESLMAVGTINPFTSKIFWQNR